MTAAPGTNRYRRAGGAGLLLAGALVGAVLTGSLSASAATSTPTPAPGATTQAAPGVQENDGIPEAQEHHGGHGVGLTGTVTAVGSDSVTIKTSAGATVTYTVTSASDIDKNGEAQLSNLAAGDAVRYSVGAGTTTIDKLHAGDETRNLPSGTAGTGPSRATGTGSAYVA